MKRATVTEFKELVSVLLAYRAATFILKETEEPTLSQ